MKSLNKLDKKEKLLNILSFIGIALGFIAISTLVFWEVYPYKPLTINQRPVEVLTKEVKRGQSLVYQLDYCKNTDKEVLIQRKFKDGLLFALPDVVTNNPEGCRVQNIALEIPHSLPEGEYILTMDFVYEMNPIRKVVVETHTRKFIVTE